MIEEIALVCGSAKHQAGKIATLALAWPERDAVALQVGQPSWQINGRWTTARARRQERELPRPVKAGDLDDMEHHRNLDLLGTLPDGRWVTFGDQGAEAGGAFTLRKYRFTCPLCPMDTQRSVKDMDLILDAAASAGMAAVRLDQLA